MASGRLEDVGILAAYTNSEDRFYKRRVQLARAVVPVEFPETTQFWRVPKIANWRLRNKAEQRLT